MELNKSLWYVRLFFFFKEILEKFCNTEFWRHDSRTNSCVFFWTYLLGSVVILAHIALYAGAVWAITGQIVQFFDWGGLFTAYSVFAASVIVALIAIVAGSYLKKGAEKLSDIRAEKEQSERANDRPSFLSVVGNHITAVKEKWCMDIVFTDSKSKSVTEKE